MKWKYRGKDYYISLTEEGKVRCNDPEATGDTVAEVQEKIKKIVAKSGRRINILTFGDRWYHSSDKQTTIYNGTTNGIPAGAINNQYWVSWKQGGATERAKLYDHSFWPDTPENRKILDEIVRRRRMIQTLEAEIKSLDEQLTKYTPEEDT